MFLLTKTPFHFVDHPTSFSWDIESSRKDSLIQYYPGAAGEYQTGHPAMSMTSAAQQQQSKHYSNSVAAVNGTQRHSLSLEIKAHFHDRAMFSSVSAPVMFLHQNKRKNPRSIFTVVSVIPAERDASSFCLSPFNSFREVGSNASNDGELNAQRQYAVPAMSPSYSHLRARPYQSSVHGVSELLQQSNLTRHRYIISKHGQLLLMEQLAESAMLSRFTERLYMQSDEEWQAVLDEHSIMYLEVREFFYGHARAYELSALCLFLVVSVYYVITSKMRGRGVSFPISKLNN